MKVSGCPKITSHREEGKKALSLKAVLLDDWEWGEKKDSVYLKFLALGPLHVLWSSSCLSQNELPVAFTILAVSPKTLLELFC